MEEFNLSKKIWDVWEGFEGNCRVEDVKEFIKRLKLELASWYPNSQNEITMKKVWLILEPYYKLIDKLAGEKLI